MKSNNQYKAINEVQKCSNSQERGKNCTFNFISGEEKMQELLLRLISCRIEGKYEF